MDLRGIHVVPSILSADFGRLRAQVEEVVGAGAEWVQIDVMDGHFVPAVSVGALAVEALRESGVGLDVHLMVERPERHIADIASAGAHHITVHQESTPHVLYALDRIHDAGLSAGVAVNPGTAAESLADLLDACELVLCMTVNPGWGGQPFIEHSIEKLRRLRAMSTGPIQVDGGIDVSTAPRCRAAGATSFVAGSAVFGAADPGGAYRELVHALDAPPAEPA